MPAKSASKSETTALITGGSSGIGLALAREIAAHGHDVVLAARNRDSLEAAAGAIEGKYGVLAHVIPTDLRRADAADQLYETISNQKLEIGILVNNAGFGLGGEFLETDLQREVEMIQVNVTAVTQLTKIFAAGMVRRRSGRVMNVASTAAFQPGPLMAVYYATKAYVLSFSEAIAEELRNTGVTVTALCPGATATAFADTAEISNTRLFTRIGIADAESVAAYGYKAMMRGERVAIPSLRDKIMVQTERLAPRALVTKIVRRIQENR
ncbi:MAG: SDR family oxidoreductase [Gemmatimonadota bacterium]|nr:SDR family oxidoreductase [Gemmatimonadota bacterium]